MKKAEKKRGKRISTVFVSVFKSNVAEDLGGSGAILGKPYFSEELAEIPYPFSVAQALLNRK